MTAPEPPFCLKGHQLRRDRRVKQVDVWKCPEGCVYTIQTEPGFYPDPDTPPKETVCACGCGRSFTPDPLHPWQEYYSTACRMRAYRQRKGAS